MHFKQVKGSPFGKPIYGRTKAHIQAAINAATDGDKLLCSGEYDFSAGDDNPLVFNKNIELIGINNCVFNGGTTASYLLKVNTVSLRGAIRNVRMVSQNTTSDKTMVYMNQEGDVNNFTFDNVDVYGDPAGNYNAFGLNAYADGQPPAHFRNITFYNCKARSGRMGWECLSHRWSSHEALIEGLYFVNPTVYSAGTATTQHELLHGMGISLSGVINKVRIDNPTMRDCLLALEIIGTRQCVISNPQLFSDRIVDAIDQNGNHVLRTAGGLSFTDGGNSGYQPNEITVTGGLVNVSGRALQTYNNSDICFYGGHYIGGEYSQFQHGFGLRFRMVDMECKGEKHICFFEDQHRILIEGGLYTRENGTMQPNYAPLFFDGNCDGNAKGIDIRTNTSLYNGWANNYYDGQPLKYNYLNSDSPTVYSEKIWWNGQLMPDHTS